ncbi:hypothetical protein WPS_30510 [Vulcanimicrobium alpinum]|uniref:Uncharacterized protein n=1 Tax=Vulcanimicrobium alpinum TaxID=3016050 RepID=A0AAN1XYL3_UNVUL|nr:hypothetical protein WPS_30510 [Vulcanimicrobium alpinum]
MLLSVADADCITLLSISGIRKTSIVRQIGRLSSMAGPRRCIGGVYRPRGAVSRAANDGRTAAGD